MRGVGHPSVFHHVDKDIWTLVHVDDDCSAGTFSSPDWRQGVLEKRYKIKSQRIGDGIGHKGVQKQNEGQVLNRVIRRSPEGYELEADLRHAELIVEQLELQSCRRVVAPGIDVEVNCAAWDDD